VRQLPLATETQSIVWLDGETLCLTGRFHAELGGQLPDWLGRACRLPGRDQRPRDVKFALPGGRGVRLVRRRQSRGLAWLWAGLRGGRMASPELELAGLLFRLERYGVPTPRLLAFGQRHSLPWRAESFLLTEEPPRGQCIGQWLQAQAGSRWTAQQKQRRQVVRDAGLLYRRLHDAHCVLKASAANALLVRCRLGCAAELILDEIDQLHRIKRVSPARAAADLADLRQLTVQSGCTRADELRFLLSYLGIDRLTPAAKQWARLVSLYTHPQEAAEITLGERASPCDVLAIAS
jgi:hypothetical protein